MNVYKIDSLTGEWKNRIRNLADGKPIDKKFQISSSFDGVNHLLGGGYGPGLTMVIGDAGTGKTTFLVNEARWQIERGEKVLFVTTEERADEVFSYFVLSRCNHTVSTPEFLTGLYPPEASKRIVKEVSALEKMPLTIIDSMLSTTELRDIIENSRPNIVYLDSLQSILPTKSNGDIVHDVTTAVTEVKNIAIENGIPIVFSAQATKDAMRNGQITPNSAAFSGRIKYLSRNILTLHFATKVEIKRIQGDKPIPNNMTIIMIEDGKSRTVDNGGIQNGRKCQIAKINGNRQMLNLEAKNATLSSLNEQEIRSREEGRILTASLLKEIDWRPFDEDEVDDFESIPLAFDDLGIECDESSAHYYTDQEEVDVDMDIFEYEDAEIPMFEEADDSMSFDDVLSELLSTSWDPQDIDVP